MFGRSSFGRHLHRSARPSAGVVVAIVALVLSLGGNAAAAIIISSNGQVAAHTISGAAGPAADHKNLIPGSIGSSDLHAGAVTDTQLATNSRAHKIDFSVSSGGTETQATLLHVDELTIKVDCQANAFPPQMAIYGKTSVAATFDVDGTTTSWTAGSENALFVVTPPGGSTQYRDADVLYRNASRVITVSLHTSMNPVSGQCIVWGLATIASAA